MSVNSKMTAIANAVRAKTGQSGTLSLDGMVSAIAGISAGGSIQRKSGSFTTSSSGQATVVCGFQPDLVIVYTPTNRFGSGDTREVNLKFAFAERKTTLNEMSDAEYENGIYAGVANPTATGFSIKMMGYSYSWSENISVVAGKSFDYVAVKYTA